MDWASFSTRLFKLVPPRESVPWDDSFEENLGWPADRSKFEEQMRHEGSEYCGEEPNCVLFHSPVEPGAPWSMSYDDGDSSEASSPCHPECREAGARQRGVKWQGMIDDETFWARVAEVHVPEYERYLVETEKDRAKEEKQRAKEEKRMSPPASAYETVNLTEPGEFCGTGNIFTVPVNRPSGEEIVKFLLDGEPERDRFGRKRVVRAVKELANSQGSPLSEHDAEEIAFLLIAQLGRRLITVPVGLGSGPGWPALIRVAERASSG